MKSIIAAATMTPITQVARLVRNSAAVNRRRALAEAATAATASAAFVAFIVAHAAADPADQAPVGARRADHARPGRRSTRGVAPDRRQPPGARAAASTRARAPATSSCGGVTLSYRAQQAPAARTASTLALGAGETVGAGRPVGRGQDDARQPAAALSSSRRRETLLLDGHAPRRLGRRRAQAPVSRLVSQGRRPLQRHRRPPTSRSAPAAPATTADRERNSARRWASANLLEFAEALPQGPRQPSSAHNAQRVLGRAAAAAGDRPRDLQGTRRS